MRAISYNGLIVNIEDDVFYGIDIFLAENEEIDLLEADSLISLAPSMQEHPPKLGVAQHFAGAALPADEDVDIDDILNEAEDTFQEYLLKLIDKKNMTDAEVYKRADIDRRHFSKIRSNREYQPKKPTVVSLALALCLNIDEAVDLLASAGYAFSPGNRADLIARYCIENKIYDLIKVNAILFAYDQPLLGGKLS